MHRFIPLLALLLPLPLPLLAAEPSPREQVLKLVPPESAVCFIVQNLREQAKAVAASPFAAWATEKLTVAFGDSDPAKQLKGLEAYFSAILGVSTTELRDEILGDAVAFAWQPGPPGKPEAERGVALLYAKSPAKLQKLIDKLNDIQKNAGEIESIEELRHGGRAYCKRLRLKGPSEFYFLHGHLFAFAAQEESLQAIIDREANAEPSPILKALDELKVSDAFLACWLNPRKLDADLAAAAEGSEDEKAGKVQVAKFWSAVDQCAFFLRSSADLELGVSMTYRGAALPAELQPLFGRAPVNSALWGAAWPEDAIFAIAGNLEVNALIDLAGSFLPPAKRTALRKQIEQELGSVVGKNKLPALLAGLGPQAGLCILRSEKSEGAMPTVIAAVGVSSESEASLFEAARFYAKAITVEYNRNHDDQMSLAGITGLGYTTIQSERLSAAGMSPAFGLKHGYFVASNRRAALSRLTLPANTLLQPGYDVKLVSLSMNSLRTHLAAHREEIVKLLVAQQSRDEKTVSRDLDTLAMILEAVESAKVTVAGDARSRILSFKLKPIKPLK